MATSYKPQATQVNEELALKSSLHLTLIQDFCDEDPKSREVHVRLEVDRLELGIIAFLRILAPW